VRAAKRAVVVARRQAWRHTAGLTGGAVALLVTLLAIGYDLSH